MTDDNTTDHVHRRNVLKAGATLAGVGTLATLGGRRVAAQETTPRGDAATEIDAVFGLPLAVEQSVPEGVEPAHTVELDVEEVENVHEGFPMRPDPQNPDRMVEAEEEFVFDPVGLRISPGDVVHFESVAHLHTVTAFHEKWDDAEEFLRIPTRIPDDVPGFHSPLLMEGASWLYEFTEPGVYDVFCLPHVSGGMVQRIVVDSPEGGVPSAPSGETFPNAMTVLSAPELDPQRIVDTETVRWSDLTLDASTPTTTP